MPAGFCSTAVPPCWIFPHSCSVSADVSLAPFFIPSVSLFARLNSSALLQHFCHRETGCSLLTTAGIRTFFRHLPVTDPTLLHPQKNGLLSLQASDQKGSSLSTTLRQPIHSLHFQPFRFSGCLKLHRHRLSVCYTPTRKSHRDPTGATSANFGVALYIHEPQSSKLASQLQSAPSTPLHLRKEPRFQPFPHPLVPVPPQYSVVGSAWLRSISTFINIDRVFQHHPQCLSCEHSRSAQSALRSLRRHPRVQVPSESQARASTGARSLHQSHSSHLPVRCPTMRQTLRPCATYPPLQHPQHRPAAR